MLESIKKLFNKLGFKHRHYGSPAKPRWTVEQLGGGYLYCRHKPMNCPYVGYYRYTGKSFNNGKFREVIAMTLSNQFLFIGYASEGVCKIPLIYHNNDQKGGILNNE